MSYEEFKKRIDTARNILVGAVPSPAGQIDQITYALMYKFMNDIDDQASALPGGKRTYFTGDYEKYNWHALMSQSLGAHERLDLYRQAIEGMAKNVNLPPLFREIYQNAFLPFNSPSVLTLFLREIDKFSHGDSDDIGDAYEYLLSITGSQGDVGQFRTPRHIIKFIVEAINPTKDDNVLDPAVGTAGFLIAAYDHVKSQHDGKDHNGGKNDEVHLSADELTKLHKNYRGFDIDPTMVRTASVNMYLHGFTTPDIINHDSLSSEDYWNDRYDVILANPPFMTPKGGIQPHKKFSVAANRAEVLFVDYIATHLKPNGRAGVVVPEGIIFQSGKAYKELRKNLVDNYLYAVVSLPAGVFQPYSGVKTSVLFLDKEQVKKQDEILFVKIENDGLSTGSQRRSISGSQFPEALGLIKKFKTGERISSSLAHTVKRLEIEQSGDYNLSGDRYRTVAVQGIQKYPLVNLGEVSEFIRGVTFSSNHKVENEQEHVLIATTKAAQADGLHYDDLVKVDPSVVKKDKQYLQDGDLLISIANSASLLGRKTYITNLPHDLKYSFGAFMGCVRPDQNVILPGYLNPFLESKEYKGFCLSRANTTTNISNLNWSDLSEFRIPLPPIEVQREIVAELDSYQKIIDAAQMIVKTYKPTIKINTEWKIEKIGDVFKTSSGGTPSKSKPEYYNNGTIAWLGSGEVAQGVITDSKNKITEDGLKNSSAKLFPVNSVLIAMYGATVGQVGILKFESATNQAVCAILPNANAAVPEFVYHLMKTYKQDLIALSAGGAQPNISQQIIRNFAIPIPSLEEQMQIVATLDNEQKLVNASKQLIETFQQKIKDKISEVWGE